MVGAICRFLSRKSNNTCAIATSELWRWDLSKQWKEIYVQYSRHIFLIPLFFLPPLLSLSFSQPRGSRARKNQRASPWRETQKKKKKNWRWRGVDRRLMAHDKAAKDLLVTMPVYFSVTLTMLSVKLPPPSMSSVSLFEPPWQRGVWFREAVVLNDSSSQIRSDSSLWLSDEQEKWWKMIAAFIFLVFVISCPPCSLRKKGKQRGELSLIGYSSGTFDIIIW